MLYGHQAERPDLTLVAPCARYRLAVHLVFFTVIHMSKRALLIGFLALALLSTGLVAPRLLSRVTVTPEQIRTAFMGCSPQFSKEDPVISVDERDCMADVMVSFYEQGHNAELWEAIRQQEFEAPYFYFPCHHTLHRVGERAYARYKDMVKLILDNNSDVCGTAFIMGGLDAFGAEKPTIEEFTAVARACESMHGEGYATRLRGMCEHSTGHVAWKSTLDVRQAAERCAKLASEAGQLACGDGVVMQVYQPANGEATIPLEEAYEGLEKFCSDWPEIGKTRLGCYGGAGYIYARQLYAYDLEVRAETEKEGVLSPEHRAGLLEHAMFVVNKCRSHSWEPGVDKCLRRAAWAIPGSVFWDTSLIEEICANYGPYKDNCLAYEESF